MNLAAARRAFLFGVVAAVFASLATGPATTHPASGPSTTARSIRVLIVAGGTSHDFKRWFEDYDAAVLEDAGCTVEVTEDPAVAADRLGRADVAVVSTNKAGFDTPAFRAALFAFADAGHGLVLLHPATWYNYDRWPEYNAKLVGGGTRSHDPIGPMSVKVLQPEHPVMAGVPPQFDLVDELYHVNPPAPDAVAAGTVPVDVLAQTSPSRRYHVPHPSVWIPNAGYGRVVCIAPGHDGRVHRLEAFRTILVNAVRWTAGG